MKTLITTLFLLPLFTVHAAERYWVASSNGLWNNTTNWATSSGGAGGASVPTTSDNVIFDENGLGDCTIGLSITVNNLSINSGYTGTLILNGSSTATIANKLLLDGGSITRGEVMVEDTIQVTTNFTNATSASYPSYHFEGSGNAYLLLDNQALYGNLYITKMNSTDQVIIVDEDANDTLQLGTQGDALYLQEGVVRFTAGVVADLDYHELSLASGSTFTASSNETQLAGSYTNQGGVFTHNSGLFTFDGGTDRTFNTLSTPDEFYNVKIYKDDVIDEIEIETGDTLVVTNTLDCNRGDLIGGNVKVTDSCLVSIDWKTGDAHLIFANSGNSYLLMNDSTWKGSITIDKANATDTLFVEETGSDGVLTIGRESLSGTLTLNVGVLCFESGVDIDLDFDDMVINTQGTFLAADVVRHAGNYLNNGGNFVHNSGTFIFNGINSSTFDTPISPDEFQNVRINKNDQSKSVTIANDAVLSVTNTFDGSRGMLNGGRVEVSGNCIIKANWGGGDTDLYFIGGRDVEFRFNNGAWKGNNVVINKTLSSDIVDVRDLDNDGNVCFGIGTKNMTIQEGTLTFESNIAADLDFDSLIIESGGTVTAPNDQLLLSGTYQNEAGTFNHNSGTFTMDGNSDESFIAYVNESLNNFIVNKGDGNEVNIPAGDTIQIAGALSLTDGVVNTGALQASGSVTVGDHFDGGTSPLIFAGSSAQTFDLSASPSNFEGNIIIDKTVAADITLQSALTLATSGQSITLSKGWLVSSSANLLTLTDGVTISGGSDESFIAGPIRKIGNDAFNFPVGKNGSYANISISAPALITDAFEAEYFDFSPHASYDVTSLASDMHHVSKCEYWILDRIAGSANVSVSLTWDDPRSCGVDDLSSIAVARWDAGDAEWKNQGNDGNIVGNTTTGTVTSAGVISTFSPFTLGTTNANNPLPIDLLSFAAQIENQQVLLNWITLTEKSNDFFQVEKSQNALDWSVVGQVRGAGNSTVPQHYQLMDDEPFAGQQYYRLKQVDYNGDYTYSNVIAISANSITAETLIYPNPTHQDLFISSIDKDIASIQLYNSSGLKVELSLECIDKGLYKLASEQLPRGIYFIHLLYDDQTKRIHKVIFN
ncbi:MAG: T9SS type A sorting domain-containing protein [Flammeovirgaceae bacterium]